MPHSQYCQTQDCANRTEPDHPYCVSCEQATVPRRRHRASNDSPWRTNRARCRVTGCEQRAMGRGGTKCLVHQTAWGNWELGPEPEPRLTGADAIHPFDIICLQCPQRQSARGTEAQANYTRSRLGAADLAAFWTETARPLGTAMAPKKMSVTRNPEWAGPSLPDAA